VRICIDLDGPICPIKLEDESYATLEPIAGASERIRELRASGHYIIILTSRNMATCESNIGKVMKNIGKVTLDWLTKYEIEYDEIYFGKPNAEVYIDDRAIRYDKWKELTSETLELAARTR